MHTTGIIQARMSSTRLPGKMMLPLDGRHVIEHVIARVAAAETVDDVVVATSTRKPDDIIATYAERSGATVFRGEEADVLGRIHAAAAREASDIIVRITGDCPLVSPACIDAVVDRLRADELDYATNIIERTFPRGLDVEAFTFDSFDVVETKTADSHHREHVTPYYRENPDQFSIGNVTADDVFQEQRLQNRTDLRLTLDEAPDYELLRTIYENSSYESFLSVVDAVEYIDEHGLSSMNRSVSQKTPSS
ncbi:cytidylyltransferase domain-containing protein [Halohasta salina]|uniref:cytidylyltransferase domain-containing protein n=1 Tax=Halohasta salina TaxID=2961621 RepID=UPI0020A38029|nr:glycosyltransferase family protein [Halohasta salina]